ncbi:NAD(P)-dependent oxidoreductase [Clostridium bowmanii]|uniref:NAD-dependent epimerase/dehydratase family protein n=1 Tax=Clostridium bowmanii TaxID=132925 RepID=UPI001C0CB60F|nr:NAD(P)-dependent oxidoreductase [Clostridium bowmanii]MBU3190610.1 NAD(P)-dependent oxidoreductase [Clostridium bowmanii]MCA1075143.1 NAD(P)-dependent oxidoreductase [Clostridium bowmanii]
MKILITGACGYLGSYCTELLNRENDIEITMLCRKIPNYMLEWSKEYKVIYDDVCNIKIADSITEKYDYVIHMAAANENICKENPSYAINTNVFGTRNMLEFCRKNKIENFIYISTFHVYGSNDNGNIISEDSKINPLNDYGSTHYFAELYCKQYSDYYGMNCMILRPSNFLTAPLFKKINRWTIVPNNFCKQIVENQKLILRSKGNQMRNFISVLDLSNSILRLINNKIKGYQVFNLGSDNYYSIYQLACITKEIYEYGDGCKSIDITYGFDNDINSYEGDSKFIYDTSKLRSLGYNPQKGVGSEIKKTILYLNNSYYSNNDGMVEINRFDI